MDVRTELVGKFLGKVSDNKDPSNLGRIEVKVPSVSDHPLTWAAPCFPVAGHRVGIFAMPPVGSEVFVEFIEGRIDHPVWVGCPIGDKANLSQRASALADGPTLLLFESGGVGISIKGDADSGGVITLYCGDGPKITISASGIVLDGAGKDVKIDGSSVDLNKGGLTVR